MSHHVHGARVRNSQSEETNVDVNLSENEGIENVFDGSRDIGNDICSRELQHKLTTEPRLHTQSQANTFKEDGKLVPSLGKAKCIQVECH